MSVCVIVVDCGLPPLVDSAIITSWFPVNSTKYQSSVQYNCTGLTWFSRKVFSHVITCEADGNWSTISACKRKWRLLIVVLFNIVILCILQCKFWVRVTIRITFKDFVYVILLFLLNLLCKIAVISCLSPPVEPHGSQSPTSVVEAPYNSSILYECNHGYWYDYNIYNAKLMCNSEGEWSPTYFPCKGLKLNGCNVLIFKTEGLLSIILFKYTVLKQLLVTYILNQFG